MNSPHIPERFLRHIWEQQRFTSTDLHTSDGRKVEILFPGLPNSDAGPDFMNAHIRVGKTIYAGDVELHRDAGEWESHMHSADPHYNRIILHVVLTADHLRRPPAPQAGDRCLFLSFTRTSTQPCDRYGWKRWPTTADILENEFHVTG